MYEIKYATGVAKDLKHLTAYHRGQVLDKIEPQLRYEPARQTRNKKICLGLAAPWQHEEPVWELRIGTHRVFYDVDEVAKTVTIRAVRYKPPHKTTEEIL